MKSRRDIGQLALRAGVGAICLLIISPGMTSASGPIAVANEPAPLADQHNFPADDLLNPAVDSLAELPGFQDSGLSPDRGELILHWHEVLGGDARAVIEAAESHGITVDIAQVPYSYDELRRYANELILALDQYGVAVDGYEIGEPFDVIRILGKELDNQPASQLLAQDLAEGILPKDVNLVIDTAQGDPIAADVRQDGGG